MKKYLKYILLAGIIALSICPVYVFAFDNLSSSRQPIGFRGVDWGVSKHDHPYLFSMYDKVEGVETFHRELENLTIDGARLTEIIYHFYNDKFYQVSIKIKSDADFQPLLDVLTESYGAPEKDSGIYVWENNTVAIRLFPGGASISYLPILNKIGHKHNNG